jgi:hypothetical protein
MPNTNASDNIANSRTLVAPNSTTHWTGSGDDLAARYIRGTIELGQTETGFPTVGRIEDCSFSEMAGGNEELDDGAHGVEAYDFWKLGWKVQLTARFRRGDAMPRIGEVFFLKMPEGSAENAALRFVVDGEPQVKWAMGQIRKISFSGKIHASMLRESLVTVRLRPDDSSAAQSTSAFPTGGFGDAVPVEGETDPGA